MMLKRHHTPRYVYNRVKLMVWQAAHPGRPWLTSAAIKVLEREIHSGLTGVEWGSGRSTTWFAERVDRLYSVEHDAEWAGKVKKMLAEKGLSGKVDYRLCPDGLEEGEATEYARSAESLGDGTQDFALVDGFCRQWCACVAVRKLKPGGLLIVDNANWYLPTPAWSTSIASIRRREEVRGEGWERFLELTRNWRQEWTSNGVTDTLLLWKPAVD